MFKINCLNPIADVGLKNFTDRYQITADINEADGVLVRSASMHEMELPENLLAVARAGAGVNNIPLTTCADKGIVVFNTPGANANAVKELVLCAMLMGSRDVDGSIRWVRDQVDAGVDVTTVVEKGKSAFAGPEIMGKTLGIIGLGAIGKRVAAIAGMFGMKVIYYSTSGTSHCNLYPSVSLDELLESSDVVSIHAPLNERTRSLIGQAQLAKMKKSALLLNLGRGGIVDEEALAFAVDNGVIAGAALDVFEKEPLPATSPLLHLRHPERFRFSPHTAWASREALARLVSKVADNIRNFYGLQA